MSSWAALLASADAPAAVAAAAKFAPHPACVMPN